MGPDGNLWFPEGGAIGRITPSGAVTEFPLPKSGSDAGALTVGPDGKLWFPDGERSPVLCIPDHGCSIAPHETQGTEVLPELSALAGEVGRSRGAVEGA